MGARARSDPVWSGQLVSPDGTAGAVLVHLESSDSALAADVFSRLRAELGAYEERGFDFHLTGGPVEFVVAVSEPVQELLGSLLVIQTVVVV